jgi:hypothetical protein
MGEKERVLVLAAGTLLLFLAPGYLVHVSPRFAGNLAGGLIGVAATLLMVLMLLYPAVKYSAWLRRRVTAHIALGRLLALHIWGGLLAALLAIAHSGHKYESPLGITLIVAVLAVVGTGFVGQFYLAYLSGELRRQQAGLGMLRAAYDKAAARLAGAPTPASTTALPLLDIVDAIAEEEYALAVRDSARRIAARWMVAHTVASILLYGLLIVHIGNGIYYGLRWLQ